MSSKPSSLLQRCRNAIKRNCTRKSDDNVIKALQTIIDALQKNSSITFDSKAPGFDPVVHNIDLGPGDDLYVLANAILELARIHDKRGDLLASEELLSRCLRLFPRFIAGLTSLAQVVRQRACCEDDLVQAEGLLRAAVAAGKELEAAEGGLVVSSNRECEKEVEAASAAQSALAMLLCQAGRDQEAAQHLKDLGFTHRLSPKVVHYAPAPSPSASPSAPSTSDWRQYTAALDNVLPPALLTHLQAAFSPASPFWTEHNYGRIGYFSYMHELDAPGTGSIPQLAHFLLAAFTPLFPRLVNAKFVEWWAHCRPHCSGHQLHFDSDDEGQGGVRNPIISTVVFLTGGVGGPTLVTNQSLGGALGDRGWLIHPKENRVGAFDGSFLHGVVPGHGPAPSPTSRRCTLMLAFWEHIECRSDPQGGPGPSRNFPHPCPDHLTWPSLLEGREGGWGESNPTLVEPVPVSEVWVPVDAREGEGNPGPAPTYDACFQGF